MSHQITNEIVDWICVTMFILGTIGNTLGFIVFSSRKFRRTTYGRLAIASLIINLLCVFRYSLLLHSDARRWVTYKASQSWFNCKLHRLSSCLRILSAFVIVAWTYERFTYVTINYSLFINHPYFKRYKFYFMAFISLILICVLTGPTIYFYEPITISSREYENSRTSNSTFYSLFRYLLFMMFRMLLICRMRNACALKDTIIYIHRLSNSSLLDQYRQENGDLSNNHSLQLTCALKTHVSEAWKRFLNDVRFGFNYTTLRSIFSEIIPSLFVILFDIGIIVHVVQSTSSISSNGPSFSSRASYRGSFHGRETGADGLVVHNRPRTSWMNIVLILHSFLFCFSSLTATIVHWSTSNPLLSHWTSVVILVNCSLNFYVYCLSGRSFRNEIRKLFYRYFQLYCFGNCMNLFRTKSQREEAAQIIRMRLSRHRSTIVPPHSLTHFRGASFALANN